MAEQKRRAVKRRHGFCDRWRNGLRDRWRRCTALAFRSGRIRGASPTATNCRRYRGSTAKQSSPFDSIRRAVKRRQHVAAGLAPQSQSNHPERRAVKRRHGFCDRWRHGLRDRWRRCTALAFRSGRIRGASPTANNCRRYRGSTATQSSSFDSI